jgi:hypothetical protein
MEEKEDVAWLAAPMLTLQQMCKTWNLEACKVATLREQKRSLYTCLLQTERLHDLKERWHLCMKQMRDQRYLRKTKVDSLKAQLGVRAGSLTLAS